ncbi:MAG: membrane bound O-acyl transferase family-domain-containing protein [Pirellulales bacterium]
MFGIGSLPRWAAMWLLALAIYAAFKLTSWLARPAGQAPTWKHALYLFAWPGMDAGAFLYGTRVAPPTPTEWAFAAGKSIAGLLVLFVGLPAWLRRESLPDYFVGWVGMIAIVVLLHFGLFHLLSCGYRQGGIDAVPIMNHPLRAHGVSEFWGRRWNLAFRDWTHRLLFHPLLRRLGPAPALVLVFLVSGVVHDAVISLPAGGGLGLPTTFFAIQGAAILFERSRWGRALGLGRRARGWLFCLALLLVSSPLLFHPPFVSQIVIPFLHAIGAVP